MNSIAVISMISKCVRVTKYTRVISVLIYARIGLDNNSIASSAGAPVFPRNLSFSRRSQKSVSGNLLKSNFVSKPLTPTGRLYLSRLIGTRSGCRLFDSIYRFSIAFAVPHALLLLITRLITSSMRCIALSWLRMQSRWFLSQGVDFQRKHANKKFPSMQAASFRDCYTNIILIFLVNIESLMHNGLK